MHAFSLFCLFGCYFCQPSWEYNNSERLKDWIWGGFHSNHIWSCDGNGGCGLHVSRRRNYDSVWYMRVVLEWVESEEVPVISGVPQGTVLGPLLFLCHINDLPDRVKSQVRLFADDCFSTEKLIATVIIVFFIRTYVLWNLGQMTGARCFTVSSALSSVSETNWDLCLTLYCGATPHSGGSSIMGGSMLLLW